MDRNTLGGGNDRITPQSTGEHTKPSKSDYKNKKRRERAKKAKEQSRKTKGETQRPVDTNTQIEERTPGTPHRKHPEERRDQHARTTLFHTETRQTPHHPEMNTRSNTTQDFRYGERFIVKPCPPKNTNRSGNEKINYRQPPHPTHQEPTHTQVSNPNWPPGTHTASWEPTTAQTAHTAQQPHHTHAPPQLYTNAQRHATTLTNHNTRHPATNANNLPTHRSYDNTNMQPNTTTNNSSQHSPLATTNPRTTPVLGHNNEELPKIRRGQGKNAKNVLPTQNTNGHQTDSLKKSLDEISSYIKDTKDFINTIEKLKVPRDALLVTIDVTGPCLNIPQKEGIKRSPDKHYECFPEEKGANLFMDLVEQEFLAKCTKKPQTWKRYIDDIFMIWTHGREELKNFITHLNLHHPNLTITWEAHEQQIDFLDAHIHKGKRFREKGILDISHFFKPTNKFQYTHFNSNHPRSTFRGLVKGEATRILRLSSDEETLPIPHQEIQRKKIPAQNYRKNTEPGPLQPHSLAEKPEKKWEEHKIPFVCPHQEHIEPHRLRPAIWTKEDGIIEEALQLTLRPCTRYQDNNPSLALTPMLAP